MPLKCLRHNDPIFAFDVETDDSWNELRKDNAANKSLRMPCCDSGVTLRISKLGTKHFAHTRRGPCSTAPESAEHLLAKRTIVDGIRRTDWTALPEQAGVSPNFGPWIADVLSTKEKSKIAFEVQWSKQADAATRHRQDRYRAAGVRGLWFFRQHDFPIAKEIPAFRLVLDEGGKVFSVKLPSPSYHPGFMSARFLDKEHYWQQSIELAEFVAGALQGRLRFAPALGATMPVEVHTASTECWRCKKPTQIVMSLIFSASRVFKGCADIDLTIHSFGDFLQNGAGIVMAMLPSHLLAEHGIGAIKPRFSRTEGSTYLSNGCVHCDALQGRFFEHELAYQSSKAFEVEAKFEKEWGTLMDDAGSDFQRWWFDEQKSPPIC
jgi:hypothetical protein